MRAHNRNDPDWHAADAVAQIESITTFIVEKTKQTYISCVHLHRYGYTEYAGGRSERNCSSLLVI